MSDLIPNPTNPLTIGAPAPASSSRATAAEGFLEQLSMASARPEPKPQPEPEPEPESSSLNDTKSESAGSSESTERSDASANENNNEQNNTNPRDEQETSGEAGPPSDGSSDQQAETNDSADDAEGTVVAHIVLNTVATASPDLEATPDLGEVTLITPEAAATTGAPIDGEAFNLGPGQTELAINAAIEAISTPEPQAFETDLEANESTEPIVDPTLEGAEADLAIDTEELAAGAEATAAAKERQSSVGDANGQVNGLNPQDESSVIEQVSNDAGANAEDSGQGEGGGTSDRQSNPNGAAVSAVKPSEAAAEAVNVDALDPTANVEADSTGTREQATSITDTDARTEKPGSATSTSSASERVEVDPGRFVSRVSRAFEAAQQRGGGPIEIRLSPPELGAMQLKLEVKEGVLTATIETENNAARNALLDNLPPLRERLAEQQISVEKFDVDVRDESGGASQQQDDANNRQASDRDARRDRGAGAPSAEANPTTAANDPNPSAPTIELGDKRINLVA